MEEQSSPDASSPSTAPENVSSPADAPENVSSPATAPDNVSSPAAAAAAPPSTKAKETGVITPEEFAQIIQQHADEQNVNWGEIEDILELYALADSASKATNGIPDYVLKEGMNYVLSLQLKTVTNGWLRNHVQRLQTLWRNELTKEKTTKRSTMVPMEAKEIHPFHDLKRFQRNRKRKLAPAVSQSIMGMSAMLQLARTKMILEDGDHEVVETQDGNIEVDGEMLSFDSWGKISGSNDAVISYENQDKFDNKVAPTPSFLTLEAAPPSTKKPKKEEEIAPAKRQRTLSEEGEIATDDENSSSSSEDESDEEEEAAIGKRAATRKQRRENVRNNHYDMKRRMQDIYAQRFDVVCYLNTEQKLQLLQSMKMVFGQEHDETMKSKAPLAKFLSEP